MLPVEKNMLGIEQAVGYERGNGKAMNTSTCQGEAMTPVY